MAFYEIETKDRRAITLFEVYYYREDTTSKYEHLVYKFNIHFLDAYEVSKNYGNLQDEFVKELQLLQSDFYDFMFNAMEKNLIKFRLEPSDYKTIEEEKKKVYDYILPKQKAFAERWSLKINCD